MKFIPNYTVSYRGAFYSAGSAFEIDQSDAEEMSRHGTVMDEPKAVPAQQDSTPRKDEAPALRRPGRPRKAAV